MIGSSGGAATAGGMEFQHCVAAWVAAHILAEKDVTPPWDLPSETIIVWLQCEPEHPVDDLLVRTSRNGFVFAQIKRSINLSEGGESDFASALDQFVRQFIACQNGNSGIWPCDRPLDPACDRLLLITSPKSSAPIVFHIPNILRRLLDIEQPLDNLAKNRDEKKALSIMLKHIKKSWLSKLGSDPSEEELRKLLRLIRIQVLDMNEGGAGDREAKTILRLVLQNPLEDRVAWTLLFNMCSNLAALQSGVSRDRLQTVIMEAGLELKAARSFQNDIIKLREYSKMTSEALDHLAQIRVGSTVVKIQRPSTEALKQAAEEKSILVVGDPGAGKSAALHDLINTFEEEGKDYIFLAVDRLDAGSLSKLRIEIGLEHELTQVINNWPGLCPAFLVIDALDAARGCPAGNMIADLIRQVIQKNGRWRVVASVRKFDLRYGTGIKELFSGPAHTEFKDTEFNSVRHLNIPHLSVEELNQIYTQSVELNNLINNAPSELHSLLRVLFNLRIMAELLNVGVSTQELTPIKTQLELLDRYWKYRIICLDGLGDAREEVLRITCEQMVKEHKLRADRSVIAKSENSTQVEDLLSNQILIEWQPSQDMSPERSILAFSHNVLFDFAVARLLLRGLTTHIVSRFVNNPESVIIVRPSILLHFHHLWMVDRNHKQFWELVFLMMRESQIPEIGKLIGPSVAAELTKTLQDLESICAALESSDTSIQNAAEQVIRHIFGALQAAHPSEIPLLGPSAGPWCQFLDHLSRNLRPPIVYSVRWLLAIICEQPEKFTADQLIAAGFTSRRLLEYTLSQPSRDSFIALDALQCVCKTFESDRAASAVLIRRCLDPQHLLHYGFEEIPLLARNAKRMISIDSSLVEEIYRTAFTYQETSTQSTQMGSGRILRFISTRKQDYGVALYELAKIFPEFLEYAPKNAIRVLIVVMEAYIAQSHSSASRETHEETFEFNSIPIRFRTDMSSIWDENGTYHHDEPMKMLNAFQQYLERIALQPDATRKLQEHIEFLISENKLAVIWRRVLKAAARHPGTLGRTILPFAWSFQILTNLDTTTPAGEFLKAVLPMLDHDERERIEKTILGIPDLITADRREEGEHKRNQLLGCLIGIEPVSEEARHILEHLTASNAVPSNEPQVRFESGWRPYGEEEFLIDAGVPIEAEANSKLRDLEQPVKKFADDHFNSTPTLEEGSSIFTSLRMLYEALSHADVDGVHPVQRDYAWGILASSCTRITRIEKFYLNYDLYSFVKTVLFEGSRYPVPAQNHEYDDQFDEHPGWGGPAPRIEVVEGLMGLARHLEYSGTDILEAIERLSNDPVPAVRFQISSRLNVLYPTAPKLMWQLIERLSSEEPSCGVLQGLLSGPLQRLAGVELNRVPGLIKTIFDRVGDSPGARKVRELSIGIFVDLYIWFDQPLCREIIMNIASNPVNFPNETPHLLDHLREPLTHGSTCSPNPDQDFVRHRAMDLLFRILFSAREELREIERSHSRSSFNDWPPDAQESAKSLGLLIERVGNEVYFASGAYDSQGQNEVKKDQQQENKRGERFYYEARPILDELADIGYPSVAHQLLETLEFFIPFDHRGVFLYIGRVVRAGKQGHFQYESLAADLIVKLIERYLAEYRTLLQDDQECQHTLIEILDSFVRAGWSNAQRLTYRLEEIFR